MPTEDHVSLACDGQLALDSICAPACVQVPLPAVQGSQHLGGRLASRIDEEHMTEFGFVLPVPLRQLLQQDAWAVFKCGTWADGGPIMFRQQRSAQLALGFS